MVPQAPRIPNGARSYGARRAGAAMSAFGRRPDPTTATARISTGAPDCSSAVTPTALQAG